jgi:L-lactate dehydrogenase
VVVTAGAKQKPGQSRLDLAATNAGILDDLMPKLLEVAPDAIYVIVTNPCDVLTVLAQRASGLPARRVFSSGTVLDTSRLRWKLAQRAGVSPASIHAHIVGEHGDSEFPLWSRATIGTVPILDWEADGRPRLTVTELDAIAEEVRTAAYTVIKGKGATNYAIGLSSARIVEAILNDERAVLPVSTVLAGVHGVDGVALSVPSIVSADGADPIRGFDLSPAESEAFQRSAAAVRDALEKLRP